jgi:hypothetical protein
MEIMPALRDDIWNATPDYTTAWQPDPGKVWRAIDESCPAHNVPPGTECPTGDFRRPVCADRVAWLRELVAAGEAGEGEELRRPEWRRSVDWEGRGKDVAGGPALQRRQRGGKMTKAESEALDKRIIELHQQGLPNTKIGEAVDLSGQSVGVRINKLKERGLL